MLDSGQLVAAVTWLRRSLLGEAFAAVDRLAGRWPEGNFRLLAAAGARGRMHFAGTGRVPAAIPTTAVAIVRSLSLARGTAVRATLRLGVAALPVKRLLAFGKRKCLSAIAAG